MALSILCWGFTAEAQQAVKRALPDRDGIHMNNIRNLNGMRAVMNVVHHSVSAYADRKSRPL
jgi:hypothetical protein